MTTPDYCIVEDGSGYTNANAFWDVDSVTQYLLNAGYSDVANYTEDQVARAIIRSTSYIEKRFRRRWRGLRQQVAQSLGWPRIGAYDDDSFTIFGVPRQVQWATAEYTIRALRNGVLAPDPLRQVPNEDLSQPLVGTTYATAVFTGTMNFLDGDTITIGARVYTFTNTTPVADGQVALGGTLMQSLLNLSLAINNAANPTTGTFTASTNFSDGDFIVIGSRQYTFHTVLPLVDASVLIGGTMAESLANLAAAINNDGDQGTNIYTTQDDPNVTAVASSTTVVVTARVGFSTSGFTQYIVSPTLVMLSSQTSAGSWSHPSLIQEPNTVFFVTMADQNVTAQATPTTLIATSTSPKGNGVVVSTTSSSGTWNGSALAGGSVSNVIPEFTVGPLRTRTQKVGPLEESQTFDGLSALAVQQERTTRSAQATLVNDFNLPEYPEADLWLEQVIRNPASGTRIVRGS